MSASVVARRYAKALYELAAEQKSTEKVQRDLAELAQALESNAELRNVFENPKFGPDLKKKVLQSVAARMGTSPVVVSTLKLLVDRGRVSAIPALSEAFATLAEERSGRIRAEIISALPLAETYTRELEKALSDATGRKVVLVKKVDPSIIGGVIAKVGDKVFDGSLKNKIHDLHAQLVAGAST